MGVYEFTDRHEDLRAVSFHMPGHKGSDLYRRFGYEAWLRDFPDRDITEIAGADNLFQPEGIIAETMEKYRRLYDARATYLLINGSSAGIIAAMMTCAGPGEKIIMARNCHKAAFNALRLGRMDPVYVYPEMIREYGIAGRIRPEDVAFAIRENPDAKAIILPSPNYYGICSDIRSIADMAHEAGMYLIVDQAHGAHLKFFEKAEGLIEKEVLKGANIVSEDGVSVGAGSGKRSNSDHLAHIPSGAESSGADIVINSIHKTLGSLTQSAILNVCRGEGRTPEHPKEIDLFELEDRLQMIQSTSPSYILMESLDINADIMTEHGDQLIGEWHDHLERFYREAKYIPGLKVMKAEGLDPTKINLDMSRIGLSGRELDEELRARGIFAELHTGNILMCMSGIGNTGADFDRLTAALKEIAWKYGKDLIESMKMSEEGILAWREGMEGFEDEEDEVREQEEEPRETVVHPGHDASVWTAERNTCAVPMRKELIPLEEAAGRVCATALIPYPPGIPLVCPGEEIRSEDIEYIKTLREKGEKVIGLDREERVSVGS